MKKSYILLHGAWHGKWCWEKVKANLENEGHQVLTPDLPGHGDNHHPFSQISLSTYVDFVSHLLENLSQPAILVGHSMAGIIISQVAEKMPERIAKLIYIAAFLPGTNESLTDMVNQASSIGISTEMSFLNENEVTLVKSNRTKNIFYNECSEDVAATALSLLKSEPVQPFAQKLNLSQERFGKVKKYYVICTKDEAILAVDQKRMCAGKVDDVIELAADHSPFLSTIDDLTRILNTI